MEGGGRRDKDDHSFSSEGMSFTEVVTHKEEVISGNAMYLGEASLHGCMKYVTQTLYEVRQDGLHHAVVIA